MSSEFDRFASRAGRRSPRTGKTKTAAKMPGWTPEEGDPPGRFIMWLNELWPTTDPFVAGERYGKHGDAAIVLVRESGQRVRWTHQSTLQKPNGLQAVVMSECGIKPRKFSTHDVMIVAWAITQLADLKAELDEMEEVALWWLRYADGRPTITANPRDEREWRGVLGRWQEARVHDEHRAPGDARQTFIVLDQDTGARYVRREDFAEHVRSVVQKGVSWPTLNSRLAEAGWSQTRIQKKATDGGAPYLSARLYVVPANWPDLDLEELQMKVGR